MIDSGRSGHVIRKKLSPAQSLDWSRSASHQPAARCVGDQDAPQTSRRQQENNLARQCSSLVDIRPDLLLGDLYIPSIPTFSLAPNNSSTPSLFIPCHNDSLQKLFIILPPFISWDRQVRLISECGCTTCTALSRPNLALACELSTLLSESTTSKIEKEGWSIRC